jgi:hypothetical protein
MPSDSNGVIVDGDAYFVDGGYVYKWYTGYSYNTKSNWQKYKLP